MINELSTTGEFMNITMPWRNWREGDVFRIERIDPDGVRVEKLANFLVTRADGRIRRSSDGRVVINPSERRVTVEGVDKRLTKKEWDVLIAMMAWNGKAAKQENILSHAWGPEYINDTQYLRVWVSRVRSIIEPNPAEPTYIQTITGYGYRLTLGDEIEEISASE